MFLGLQKYKAKGRYQALIALNEMLFLHQNTKI